MSDSGQFYLPSNFGFEQLVIPRRKTHADRGIKRGSSMLICGQPGSLKTSFGLSLLRELMREEKQKGAVLYLVSTELDRAGFRARYEHVGWFNDDKDFGDEVFSQDRVRIITVDQMKMPQPTLGAEELVNNVFIEMQRMESRTHEDDARSPVFVMFDGVTALLKDSRNPGSWRRNFQEILNRLRREFDQKRLGLVLLTGDAAVGAANGVAVAEDAVDIVMHLGVRHVGGGRRSRTLEITRSIGSSLALGDHVWTFLTQDNCEREIAVSQLLKWIEASQRSKSNRFAPTTAKLLPLPGILDSQIHGERWGMAAFFPHPTLPAVRLLQNWRADKINPTVTGDRIPTGIPGMDEMLDRDGNPDYWARPARQIMQSPLEKLGQPGLYTGAVTLLLGRSGSGKTIASLQFLLAETDPKNCLYINFENRPHRVYEMFPGDDKAKRHLARCHMLYRRSADLDIRVLIAEIRYIVNTNHIRRIAIDGLSDLWSPSQSSEISQLVEDLIVTIRDMDFERRQEASNDGKVKKKAAEQQKQKVGLPVHPGDQKKTHITAKTNDKSLKQPDSEETAGFASKYSPVTIMVTLELTDDTDRVPLLDQILFAADNVLLLRQITLNEERHKTIQVIKSRGNAPDRNVREVQIQQGTKYPLRVVPGLESFRELFSGAPKPVRVTLQLAEENKAESKFNKKLVKSLRARFGYRFHRRAFTRENLDQTLRDLASNVNNRVAQADVTLFSIDEWWVRDLRCQSNQSDRATVWETQHPLMNLTPFLVAMSGASSTQTNQDDIRCTRFPSDYWLIEFEKASIPVITEPRSNTGKHEIIRNETVACPGYLDFGLFCVAMPVAESYLKDSDESDPLISRVPRCWARFDESGWIRETRDGEKPTLLDAMQKFLDERIPDLKVGFAFDMETPINAVCTLLELAWSFGAAESFLFSDVVKFRQNPDSQEKLIRTHPLTLALRFLQYLVLKDLMPPVPSLDDTEKACFSRHWFSTYQHTAVCKDKNRSGKDIDNLNYRSVPLPFQPVGLGPDGLKGAIVAAARDVAVRIQRLTARVCAAAEYRSCIPDADSAAVNIVEQCRNFVASTEKTANDLEPWEKTPEILVESTLIGMLDKLDGICNEIQRLSTSPMFDSGVRLESSNDRNWRFRTAAEFLDRRDISLMCSWHRLRSRLLRAQLAGESITSGTLNPSESPSPDQASQKVEPSQDVTALAGYACEGSWLLGISRTTHSPALSANIVMESTSLEHARERSEQRAGIPARKDFYQSSGKARVVGLPPASEIPDWQTLLNCLGSRGRRRDRIACPRVAMSEIFNRLHAGMLNCLQSVSALKHAGVVDPSSELQKISGDVVRNLFREIAQLMEVQRPVTRDKAQPTKLEVHSKRHCPQPDCKNCLHREPASSKSQDH